MVVGIVTLIGVMAGVTALFVAIDWTNTLPPHHPAAVVASTIALLGGALIIGYVVVGLLDAIVFYLLNDLVFSRLNMAAFENKIAWVAIVITNILLATYGPFSISVSGSGSPGLWFHDPLFRVLIGALVPATLAWDWVTTWFRFRKVQKGGLTLPNEKSFYEDKKV